MKHLLLLAILFAFSFSSSAQRVNGSYSASGGLLGAVNYNKLRITGENLNDTEYGYKVGWSLGAWLNLPLGNTFSLEPQVMYSLYVFNANNREALIPSGNLSYISIPLLLKIHPRDDIAFTLGPQFDLLGSVNDAPEGVTKDDFTSMNIALSAGVEFLPHIPVVLFARYIHGLSDLDNRNTSSEDAYLSTGFQIGAKLNLFGKPKDTDDDGIVDRDDACPTVFGLAAFDGCPDTDADGITDASDECPTIAGVIQYKGCPIPDTDKDGINDEMDKCITVAGVAKYDGCPVPDTDNDGINDENDRCPSVAGIAKYNGCPIPDTDSDGINDENDQCPTVAGLAIHNGCPPPDRDNDGVLNDQDLCPDVPGPASNFGCPVVESAKFNARMINFKTGSAELTPQSKLSLREGAALMNSSSFATLIFHIHGHTDSDGSDAFNHDLSHRRAASVRAELIKNGVSADRMTSEGFGEKQPIATNETAAGKALNRRVEILARHSQSLHEPVIVPKQ